MREQVGVWLGIKRKVGVHEVCGSAVTQAEGLSVYRFKLCFGNSIHVDTSKGLQRCSLAEVMKPVVGGISGDWRRLDKKCMPSCAIGDGYLRSFDAVQSCHFHAPCMSMG